MSSRRDHWSVTSAKAALSRVVEDAQARPQVIERRGKPVAVVVAINQFEKVSASARWQKFLAESAAIRAEGGAELRVPRRQIERRDKSALEGLLQKTRGSWTAGDGLKFQIKLRKAWR